MYDIPVFTLLYCVVKDNIMDHLDFRIITETLSQ